MKKLRLKYIHLAMLFCIVGIVLCVRWYYIVGSTAPECLFYFLPAVAFLIAHTLTKKTKQKYMRIVVKFFCYLAVVIWGGASLVVESVVIHITEVTNINRYEGILEDQWSYNNGVNHFPRPIPADAQNVRFSFVPGFLQGGGKIELCYSTSPEIIFELYDRFSKLSATSSESDEAKEYEEMMDGVRYNYFSTNLFDGYQFPKDFEIMVFENKAKASPSSYEIRKGVAISKQRNEITYWAKVIK